jgi:hypothetical protein
LLDARIVSSLLGRSGVGSLAVLVVVDIAQVPLGNVLGRLLCGGRGLGRRSRGSVWHLAGSAYDAGDCFWEDIGALRAVGEARPGPSDVLESWRAKDPYGLLSSSSHMPLI